MGDAGDDENRSTSGLNRWTVSIGLILCVVLAVNGYMAYLAFEGGPGLVVSDYYERGKSYAARTDPRYLSGKQNRAPGVISISSVEGENSFVRRVRLTAEEKLPVAEATLFLYRPSDASKDFSFPMKATQEGGYTAVVRFPVKGYWDLIVEINAGDKQGGILKYARRIEVTR